MSLLPDAIRNHLAEVERKARAETVYVAVVGDFKRGKSSLINALLGAPVLPTGVLPLTALPTLIRYGDAPRVIVTDARGGSEVGIEQLPGYATEAGNPGNRRGVEELWVEYPSPLLTQGLVLVDTPGTGSLYEHNSRATMAFLPRIDVVVGVLTAEAPLSRAELELLREAAAGAGRVAVCLNKADLLTPDDLEAASGFVRRGLQDQLNGFDPPIFAVSARGNGGDSGMEPVRSWLALEVAGSRAEITRIRAQRAASSALNLAQGAVALERAALLAPAEVQAQREERVRQARLRLERTSREVRAALNVSAQELRDQVIDPEVQRFRVELAAELAAADEGGWPELLMGRARARSTRIRDQLSEPLRAALAECGERLDATMAEFLGDILATYEVDSAPSVEWGQEVPQARLRVFLADEPGALAVGISSLREVVPGRLGTGWRRKARTRAAEEAADRMAGRLRYAAATALETATREWAAWLQQRSDGEASALSEAIARGRTAVAAGAGAAKPQLTRLDSTRAALERLRSAIGSW